MTQQFKTEAGTVVEIPATIETESASAKVSASLWEKNGQSRIYIKLYFRDGSKCDCGYWDAKEGKSCISSRPSAWGIRLEREIQSLNA